MDGDCSLQIPACTAAVQLSTIHAADLWQCRSRLSHNKLAAFRADHACSFADRTSRVRDATALHTGVRICIRSFRTWRVLSLR